MKVFILAFAAIPAIVAAFSAESLLCQVNKARAVKNLEPFGLEVNLLTASQSHAEDMAKSKRITTVGTDGSTPSSRAKAAGVKFRFLGEAVAAGYRTDADMLKGLMNDPRFNDYFFSKEFEMFGAGFARDENDFPYWSMEFVQLWKERTNVPKCPTETTLLMPPQSAASPFYRESK